MLTEQLCLTPWHVYGVPARVIVFGEDTFFQPVILTRDKKVVAIESSTLCEKAAAVPVSRYGRITVRHRPLPFGFPAVSTIEGARAACLQHMLDVLDGWNPCRA